MLSHFRNARSIFRHRHRQQKAESEKSHSKEDSRVRDFALVATQRTGSTLLEELLSYADDCYTFPELFSVQQPFHVSNEIRKGGYVQESEVTDFQETVLKIQYGLYRLEKGEDITLGAHLMWNQISDALVERLINRGQKMIFLQRENILAVYRSAKFAREKRLSHVRGDANPDAYGVITYDQIEFGAFLKKIRGFYGRGNALNAKFPSDVITVKYDQLAQNKLDGVNQIRAFLGLAFVEELASDLQKRQSTNVLQGFDNPDDVKAGMLDFGTEYFLEPEY